MYYIRAKIRKYEIIKIMLGFVLYKEKYKNLGTKCHKCRMEFVNDELLTLAVTKLHGNKLWCEKCGIEASTYPEIKVIIRKKR